MTAGVHRLFEQQATSSPDATSLLWRDQRMSYRELNKRSNRLARHLVAAGVGLEVPVGVCLRRSPEMVTALLAVIKAGGAYVPLDPDYPRDRLEFMLTDTGTPVVVTDSLCAESLPSHVAKRLLIDHEVAAIEARSPVDLDATGAANDLIYIMYTSGSTGRPKGVMIEHRGVVRLVTNADYLSFDKSQRFIQLAPSSFDASTLEIWGPLLNGGTLVLMPPGTPSLQEIGDAIRRFGVTTLWLPAGLFNLMIDQNPAALRPLKQLVTGGDAASIAHFRRAMAALPDCRVVNGYGPTECTTFAVCLTAHPENLQGHSVPIGRPINGTSVIVLDSRFNRVPEGEIGELYIGGDGVARGYLNDRDLTAEKFVVPKGSSDRFYRTGDLVRHLANGTLEFLGRVDDQVKISGYRVEPGEIAETLRLHPAIRDAAVLVEKGRQREPCLTAYLAPRSLPAPSHSEMRSFLLGKLPNYMMPAGFVTVGEIPLTANGKIDRDALVKHRKPELTSSPLGSSPVWGNSLAEIISSVWREVLRRPSVGTDDNFFELGGDSLQLIEAHAKLEKLIAQNLSITDLFQYPTVASLSTHLNAGPGSPPPSDEPGLRARRQRELLERRRVTHGEGHDIDG
jgi:amino acid adenylation domain-containing protein